MLLDSQLLRLAVTPAQRHSGRPHGGSSWGWRVHSSEKGREAGSVHWLGAVRALLPAPSYLRDTSSSSVLI